MVIYQVTWNEGGMDEHKNRENIFTYTKYERKKMERHIEEVGSEDFMKEIYLQK